MDHFQKEIHRHSLSFGKEIIACIFGKKFRRHSLRFGKEGCEEDLSTEPEL